MIFIFISSIFLRNVHWPSKQRHEKVLQQSLYKIPTCLHMQKAAEQSVAPLLPDQKVDVGPVNRMWAKSLLVTLSMQLQTRSPGIFNSLQGQFFCWAILSVTKLQNKYITNCPF